MVTIVQLAAAVIVVAVSAGITGWALGYYQGTRQAWREAGALLELRQQIHQLEE